MDITKLTEEFETIEEMKAFAASQFKQILNLSKKVKELEEERSHLKKLLQDGVPMIAPINSIQQSSPQSNLLITDDAKTIAQVQLKMLKDIAFDREFTLEETKKLEIFNKVLNTNQEKPETFKANAKELNEQDLLALVGSNGK